VAFLASDRRLSGRGLAGGTQQSSLQASHHCRSSDRAGARQPDSKRCLRASRNGRPAAVANQPKGWDWWRPQWHRQGKRLALCGCGDPTLASLQGCQLVKHSREILSSSRNSPPWWRRDSSPAGGIDPRDLPAARGTVVGPSGTAVAQQAVWGAEPPHRNTLSAPGFRRGRWQARQQTSASSLPLPAGTSTVVVPCRRDFRPASRAPAPTSRSSRRRQSLGAGGDGNNRLGVQQRSTDKPLGR